MKSWKKYGILWSSAALVLLGNGAEARADVVTDWNIKARELVVDAGLPTPHSNRALAIVHSSVFEAVNAITKEYPSSLSLNAADDASVEAAIASAVRSSLLHLMPEQHAAIEAVYSETVDGIADSTAKTQGIEIGQQAAAQIWSAWRNDGSGSEEAYRPYTAAGIYVPTTIPAVPQWAQRQTWLLSHPAQFRPGPPPALTSEAWAEDFAEVQAMGESDSVHRSEEQTNMAKFWEATLPPIYHGVVHSVANMPGRGITQNARLFAAITRATDDAMIAVFDAKYHYQFWRPITAIRNADIDGNEATQVDSTWKPFIPTPMHPEYPCAHCVVAGTVGAILKAEIGEDATPDLWTVSYTDDGTQRHWTSVDGFIEEVANARIYDGVHYRTSTEVGTAMGLQIGALAVETYLSPVER